MEIKGFFESQDGYNEYYKKNDLSILRVYLNEVDNIKMLSLSEEKELLNQYKKGNKEAFNRLVEANLRLVLSVAYNFRGCGLSIEDLIQEGNIGLVYAIQHFKDTYNSKFSTYAYYWIYCCINRAVKSTSRSIHLPENVYNEVTKYRKAKKELESKLEREVTIEEIADYMKISIDEAKKLYFFQLDTVSTNNIVDGDNDNELGDLIPSETISPEDEVIEKDLKDNLRTLFVQAGLSEKEIDIVTARFGLNNSKIFTLKELGNKYGISGESVRVIAIKALDKLRLVASKDDNENYFIEGEKQPKKVL